MEISYAIFWVGLSFSIAVVLKALIKYSANVYMNSETLDMEQYRLDLQKTAYQEQMEQHSKLHTMAARVNPRQQ